MIKITINQPVASEPIPTERVELGVPFVGYRDDLSLSGIYMKVTPGTFLYFGVAENKQLPAISVIDGLHKANWRIVSYYRNTELNFK